MNQALQQSTPIDFDLYRRRAKVFLVKLDSMSFDEARDWMSQFQSDARKLANSECGTSQEIAVNAILQIAFNAYDLRKKNLKRNEIGSGQECHP